MLISYIRLLFQINSVEITFCSFLRTDQQKNGAENLAWKNDVYQLLETIQKGMIHCLIPNYFL